MSTYTYATVADAAYGQKLDFNDFVIEWLDSHDITDDIQQEYIRKAMLSAGWKFFEPELIDYFSASEEYFITADREVIVSV